MFSPKFDALLHIATLFFRPPCAMSPCLQGAMLHTGVEECSVGKWESTAAVQMSQSC